MRNFLSEMQKSANFKVRPEVVVKISNFRKLNLEPQYNQKRKIEKNEKRLHLLDKKPNHASPLQYFKIRAPILFYFFEENQSTLELEISTEYSANREEK